MLLESSPPLVPGGKQPPPDGLLKVSELGSVLEFEDERVPARLVDSVSESPLIGKENTQKEMKITGFTMLSNLIKVDDNVGNV